MPSRGLGDVYKRHLFYYPGFLFLMANTTWVEEQDQLQELIRVEEGGARRFGRLIRKVL